jgi:hypothetical protein
MSMDKDKNKQGTDRNDLQEQGKEEDKNPFKETSLPNEKANPVEDSEAEQQRKDALTERD